MKRQIISAILIFSFLTIYAQSNLTITNSEKIIGKNYLTNKELKAKEYVFPQRIDHSFIDTTTNQLTVQLRGLSKNGKWLNNSGDLILYDLTNKILKWSKKIQYQQGSIEQFDNVIIQTIANKSYCLNIENGQNLWEVKNTIYYVEPFRKIGLGYKFKTATGFTNTLEGIDLTNGNSIWKREINREYSWNNIFHLNDSITVVAAAGLHSINLRNGDGWDYNTVTGKKDYTETALTDAAGALVGVLTGSFFMATGHNLVRDVVSNILVDSSRIFMASKEKLIRLNHEGEIGWTTPLPDDLTSNSSIFIRDTILFLINKGYAFMGYRQLDFGKPFLAAFNINTGKQFFLNPLSEKKDHINGFRIKNDTVLFVFKDKISKYSLKTGEFLTEKSFNVDSIGELRYFIGDQVYLKTDSTYNSLTALDSSGYFLYTKSRKILNLNSRLDIKNKIEYNQIYLYYLKSKDFKFLAKENESVVIDNSNKKVADLKISSKAILLGSTLFDIQEKSFFTIDLSDLIN
jgi:outer membrane protein assembly factor BamB